MHKDQAVVKRTRFWLELRMWNTCSSTVIDHNTCWKFKWQNLSNHTQKKTFSTGGHFYHHITEKRKCNPLSHDIQWQNILSPNVDTISLHIILLCSKRLILIAWVYCWVTKVREHSFFSTGRGFSGFEKEIVLEQKVVTIRLRHCIPV